ncbi:MAG: phosphoribosylanthranilate isomerase [Bacteroidia bacterium]|nr:phosphoribosylanthranilate isomerase [Bacteroidia bacterium]
MKRLLIKVCGMRDDAGLKALHALQPDMIGFVFYTPSPRYAGIQATKNQAPNVTPSKKVGVFVDASLDEILARTKAFGLDYLQLHGTESPEFCLAARECTGCKIIKALPVAEAADLSFANKYEGVADYILFDTKTPNKGGSGCKFDWKLLDSYNGNTPFIISGGIDLEALVQLKKAKWPTLVGVDLNSRFELSPGIKDIPKLKNAIEMLRSNE